MPAARHGKQEEQARKNRTLAFRPWRRSAGEACQKEKTEVNAALDQLGQFQAKDWTARGDDKRGAYGILDEKKSVSLELPKGNAVLLMPWFSRKSYTCIQ